MTYHHLISIKHSKERLVYIKISVIYNLVMKLLFQLNLSQNILKHITEKYNQEHKKIYIF